MPFTTPYTFVALNVLTAAQLNAIQANITALFPYSAQGDIAVASSATALTALAKPSKLSHLTNSSGGVLAWLSEAQLHKISFDTSTTEVTTTSTSGTNVTGMQLTLTTTETCTILMWFSGSSANTGGGSGYYTTVGGQIDGTDQTNNASLSASYYPVYEPISGIYWRTGVAAGSLVCRLKMYTANASGTAYFKGGNMVVAAFLE